MWAWATNAATSVDAQRKRIAHQLLADVRRLDRQVKAASLNIRQVVREHETTLTEVFGIGPILAAKLLGEPPRVQTLLANSGCW